MTENGGNKHFGRRDVLRVFESKLSLTISLKRYQKTPNPKHSESGPLGLGEERNGGIKSSGNGKNVTPYFSDL